MKSKRTKLIALFICLMLVISLGVAAADINGQSNEVTLVNAEEIPLKLWYDEEALKDGENAPTASANTTGEDIGWERWSLPIGNGYAGANVFGRTETERIQISEKTLRNTWSVKDSNGVSYNVGGMNSFSETYIDFGHKNSDVKNYERYLDLKTAISGVEYTYNGVKYTREYFVSYPDKAIVIRLDADTNGELDFVLRPTIPYEQSYGGFEGDGITKEGTVTSKVENGVGHIELAGKMGYYDIDFLGLYRVYTDGGEIQATTTQHTYEDKDGTSKTDTDGTITVTGANSAYIVLTLGSDYELTSELFNAADTNKPTKNTDLDDTRVKVGGYMDAIDTKISGKSYESAYKVLKDAHVADHSNLFGRVAVDLNCKSSDYEITTDKLLENYKNGAESTYLETLLFQYGRYLLVASSREDTLPATLQGVWNTYNVPAWASDYTHNINLQMNYWSAFSTNLAETFDAYVDYNAAYMEKAETFADEIIDKYNPSVSGEDGGNGWVIGAHIDPYKMTGDRSAGHLGFTTQLFWEYYDYTKDPAVLESVYKILVNAARYITKCVELDEDGNYLVSYCDSPETHIDGVWYYTTGTTYAQTFAYQNNYNALCAAKELGIDLEDSGLLSQEEYSILSTIMEQIDKYDPIHVGLSGQIKEFREETYYGSMGDEYDHRHISQLTGLYPANIINSNTPAWLDAAKVTLSERGDGGTGWSKAHKINLWARAKDGDRAHDLLSALMKNSMAANLWNIGKPYQIDGNLGATAGVSEMLLQSHEGYIAPLAAIPDNWSTGSYSGLVARGNFEVSAAWKDGVATQFDIHSNIGGTASVYYPTITNASVVTADGDKVNYTVKGTNLISFDTKEGETYVITGLEAQDTQEAPSDFGYVQNDNGAYELSWKAPTGAASYNVYVAIENDATYTLVGNTTNTKFTYIPDEVNKDARITFAVTAVSISGVESERTLCYTSDPLQTEYGTIPGSEVGYPFALFVKGSEADSEYVFVDSFTSFIKAMNEVKTLFHPTSGQYKGGTAVIYMTRDCKVRGDSFNEGSLIDGTVIFDLGGHNATMGVNRLIGFNANAVDGSVDHTLRVEVKNGTVLTLKKPVAELYSDSGNNYTGTKKFELLFENITFRKADVETSGVTLVNSRGTFSSTKQAELKVDFNNCTFDYAYQTSDLTLIDCSQGGEYAKCDVTIAGGTIKASNLDTVTVFSGSKNDTISYVADENGNETVFEVTGDTKYGSIPAADMTKDKYFAMFAKGANDTSYTYQGTFGSLFKGALNNGRDKVKRGSGAYAGGTVVIYMIKDYVYDPLTNDTGGWNRAMQIDGTMVMDLAGHELTANRPRLIGFETNSGDMIGTASEYNTAVQFKNGTIKTDNPIIEVIAGGSTFTGTKSAGVHFDNITFGPNTGTGTHTIVKAKNAFKTGQTIDFDVCFTDCTFDYTSSGKVVLYDDTATGDISNPVDATVKVNGGNIKVTDTGKLTLRTDTAKDSVTFGKNANGQRTTFTLNYAQEAPSTAFTTDEGEMHLASATLDKQIITEQSEIIYSFSNVKAGDYGYIPLNESSRTFSVFYNNLHVGSFDNLNHTSTGALNTVKNLLYAGDGALKGKTLTIYTNKDYENNITTNRFDNYAQIDGNIVLDLGGHTITQQKDTYLFNLVAKAVDNTKLPVTSTTVKNGKIITTSHEIMIVHSDGTTGNFGYEGTKTFDFTYENVTFDKHTSYATYYAPLVKVDTFKDNGGKKNAALNVTFDNCTFNSNDSVLFNCATSNYVDVSATIIGGKLTAHTMGETGLMKGSDSADKLTIGKNSDGSRTTFTLDYAETAPTVALTTDAGKMYLAAQSVTADSISKKSPITYSLSNVKAGDNGYIPLSKVGNTFYVFYNNLYMGDYAKLNDSSGAVNAVKNLMFGGNTKGALAGKTVTIYMNKDYELAVNSYANYAQIDGTVVLDLGGHTLTQTEYNYLFNLTAKAVDGKLPTTTTIVKNGTILTTSDAIMKVQSGSNFTYTGTKTFDFTYDNVTFEKHVSKATYYAPLAQVVSFSDNSGTKNVALNATYNNCTINSKDSILFNCATSNYVDVNVTINGGSLTAKSFTDSGLMTSSDSNDKYVFGKYDGAYMTLYLPTGSSTPKGTFNGGSLEFVLASETLDELIFKLAAAGTNEDLKTYSPKMSLTLHSNLRMNVYVPEGMTQTFSIDGVAEQYDSKVTLDDGKVYYRKSIKLTSSDAIRDVVLKVTVSAGGKDVNGTFTFSILKYANQILTNGNDVEKQLIRDVLSYVRASYKYFKPDNTDVVAKIDALIGAKYDQLDPFTPEEVTVNPTSFRAATFQLGDTPAFRFYLKDGDSASKYSFKINDKDVNASTGSDSNGTYLQISAYAYEMDDVIRYYVDGAEVGSYHIANYYEWVTGQNNAELVSLVERFWTYCQSARDYKDSVEVQIKYVDEAGTELATAYTGTYKKGEEFSVLSPSVSGYYTRDVYKIASATSDTVFKVVYKKIPSNVNATTAKSKLPDMVAWGDSITIGIGQDNVDAANTYGINLEALGSVSTGTNYPTVLQNLIRSRVYSGLSDIANCGVGGETTASIAARADTKTYYLYLDGAVTISTSEVVVPLTHYASQDRIGILRQGGKPTVNDVTIVGKNSSGQEISVKGTLDCTLTDDAPAGTNKNTCDAKYLKYTFKRSDGGTNTLNFVSGARVLARSSYQYDGRTCIIFMGENGGYKDVNELIKQQEEILEAGGSPKQYLIVSTTSGSNSTRAAMEKALTERWGNRYISMGHELNSSRKAYELVGFSEADIVSVMDKMVEGKVSSLLIKDNCHPNAVGYAAIGNIMFERMYELGMFNELFDYYDSL